jgi:hypothetical protein
MLSLLILVTPVISVVTVQASTSEEDEEETTTEEEDNGSTEEETTTATPAPAPVTPEFPFTTPPVEQQQQQTIAPAPVQTPPAAATPATPQPASQGATVEDLLSKYGANRTLTLEATGETISGGKVVSAGQNATGDKAVILTFDDNWLSQYTFAAPILENNKFNGTFFTYCLGVAQGPAFLNPDQLRDLHARGFDIESHSMTHPDLEHVSAEALDFEIRESKPCLQDMVPGLNVTVFATPFATGGQNATILQEIADSGYEFARVGYGENFNIQCAADWYVPQNQSAGCQLFEPGTNQLKVQSRYNMPTLDVNTLGRENNHNLNATETAFETLINDAITYQNETGKIQSVPILVYHNFTNRVLPPEEMGQSLLAESFAQQMQYLKDNGFVALSMRDLAWHPENQTFSIPKLDAMGYTTPNATATAAAAATATG